MIKKIILAGLFFFSLQTIAQEGTASPYSYYGIGEVKFKGTIENRSMGGLGVLNDSIHINLQNPAALSSLKLTTFTAAGTFSPTVMQTSTEKQKAQRTSLDYLAIAFPAGKAVFNVGLMPYTSVGYKIENTNYQTNERTRNTGKGGLNNVFLGAGYQLTPKLSVGAQFSYNFGEITHTFIYLKGSNQYSTRELNTTQLNGVNLTSGLTYSTKLTNKLELVSSATFSPEMRLNATNTRNIARTTFNSQGTEVAYGSTDVEIPDTKIKAPSKITFGAGVGESKNWFVGVESTFKSQGNYDIVYPKASFESASKVSIGGYYIPKYNSFTNYYQKVTYRGGFRHENTGLIVNSQSIKDTAFTLGLGLPLSGTFSNINIGFEMGKRGTKNAGLIQENYTNFSIGLSFNDRWFQKRKFD
ncbi:MAG: hypothetical protein KBC58_07730 [Flavobacterium sp.]|nr:hypothetical protein [Flavobacterium sp.]